MNDVKSRKGKSLAPTNSSRNARDSRATKTAVNGGDQLSAKSVLSRSNKGQVIFITPVFYIEILITFF